MGLDPWRHISAIATLVGDVARGKDEEAGRTKSFYGEYFAVIDVTAEFYLETARSVFIDFDLARGRMRWRDRPVKPSAIRSALLTIEAENDRLCPPGQTVAAHELCAGIPKSRKHEHVQPGVGHYGVFSGTRFDRDIYPRIKAFVARNERLRVTS